MNQKRILCVDDRRDDCELFSFILSQAGYEVRSTQSIESALQLLENSPFDLYLFDLLLAEGTGFELLEKVKMLNLSTPIIICSGDARDATRIQAMQAGAQAFITKPIDCDLLVKTVAQLLNLDNL